MTFVELVLSLQEWTEKHTVDSLGRALNEALAEGEMKLLIESLYKYE